MQEVRYFGDNTIEYDDAGIRHPVLGKLRHNDNSVKRMELIYVMMNAQRLLEGEFRYVDIEKWKRKRRVTACEDSIDNRRLFPITMVPMKCKLLERETWEHTYDARFEVDYPGERVFMKDVDVGYYKHGYAPIENKRLHTFLNVISLNIRELPDYEYGKNDADVERQVRVGGVLRVRMGQDDGAAAVHAQAERYHRREVPRAQKGKDFQA